MNAREIFNKARRLHRRSLNEKYRTPIVHDTLYTRSGRNGSYNPAGFNKDRSDAFIMLSAFGPEGQVRVQRFLHGYTPPRPIMSYHRVMYQGRYISRAEVRIEVRAVRNKFHPVQWYGAVPTPKLPR